MSAHQVRLVFIAALLTLAAAGAALVRPASRAPVDAPDLEAMLPEAFADWRRVTLSQAVLPAETELAPGEAVAYRAYRDNFGRTVTMVAAYGPPLGDSVRLHRPEKCYVAQGFAIRRRMESALPLANRAIPIVNLDTESPSRREAVTYWLRDGSGFTTQASDFGWRRLNRDGSRPLDGALVRVSTINAELPQFDLHRDFLTAFVAAIDEEAAAVLLGEGPPR